MQVGNILFVHRFQQTDDQESDAPRRKHTIPSVMVYPRSDALSVNMTTLTNIMLGEIRRLSLILDPGSNSIDQCQIRVQPASAGLRLAVHESRSATSLTVRQEQETQVIEFDKLQPGKSVSVDIPFSVEVAATSSIVVKCEVEYHVGEQVYRLFETCNIDILLPVSVNVQDIYRESSYFSKFLIRPATLVPIVLRSCRLEEATGINIATASIFQNPQVVFPQHPANWTVKIDQEEVPQWQRLVLNVCYQRLDEVLLGVLMKDFTSMLEDMGHSQASRFLGMHLARTVKNSWTEQDLEVAGLMKELEVWKMQDIDWPSALRALGRNARGTVKEVIEHWHSKTTAIPVDLKEAPVRVLKLPVDLPPRPLVVQTGLTILQGLSTVAVGQPLICKLTFKLGTDRATAKREEEELSYELFAPSEAWLIGGRKKGVLKSESEEGGQQIVLFAQRTGALLLPMIDVKYRRRGDDKTTTAGGWFDCPIEVHNTTLSKSIRVVSNLRSTTIGVTTDEETQASRGLILDSQSRTHPQP
jgi:hypothetical protein